MIRKSKFFNVELGVKRSQLAHKLGPKSLNRSRDQRGQFTSISLSITWGHLWSKILLIIKYNIQMAWGWPAVAHWCNQEISGRLIWLLGRWFWVCSIEIGSCRHCTVTRLPGPKFMALRNTSAAARTTQRRRNSCLFSRAARLWLAPSAHYISSLPSSLWTRY